MEFDGFTSWGVGGLNVGKIGVQDVAQALIEHNALVRNLVGIGFYFEDNGFAASALGYEGEEVAANAQAANIRHHGEVLDVDKIENGSISNKAGKCAIEGCYADVKTRLGGGNVAQFLDGATLRLGECQLI